MDKNEKKPRKCLAATLECNIFTTSDITKRFKKNHKSGTSFGSL